MCLLRYWLVTNLVPKEWDTTSIYYLWQLLGKPFAIRDWTCCCERFLNSRNSTEYPPVWIYTKNVLLSKKNKGGVSHMTCEKNVLSSFILGSISCICRSQVQGKQQVYSVKHVIGSQKLLIQWIYKWSWSKVQNKPNKYKCSLNKIFQTLSFASFVFITYVL